MVSAGLGAVLLGACALGGAPSEDGGDDAGHELSRPAPEEPEDAAGHDPDGRDEPEADEHPDDDAEQPPGEDERTVAARPDWLGTRELPRRDDGFGQPQQTPEAFVDRRQPVPQPLRAG